MRLNGDVNVAGRVGNDGGNGVACVAAEIAGIVEHGIDHQYQVTFGAVSEKGFVPAKLHTEVKGLKVVGPTRVYVP